jgi:hypothetical protein
VRIAGIVLLLLGPAVVAQENAGGPGLDLVILVNRSSGVHDVLLHIALDLVCRNAELTGIQHRVAVVSFGPSLRIERPMTTIRRNAFLEPESESRSRGDIGLRAAFSAARQILSRVPAGPQRKRAILVIGDGPPFAGAMNRDVPVRVLPVRPDRLEMIAAAHGVVSDLVGTRAVESHAGPGSLQTLFLPPYLDSVVFDVFGDSGGGVSVYAPDVLQPLTAGSEAIEGVRAGDALASVIVRRPAAGQWTFRALRPGARVSVFSQQFFPRGLLVEPAQSPRQHDRVRIDYRVLDGDGRPLRELPKYPLALQLTLTEPSAQRRSLVLTRRSGGGSPQFRTREAVECDDAGRYWTEVEIATRDGEGRQVTVFQDRWSGFSVAPATLIECGGQRSGHQIEIQCRDLNKVPVDLLTVAAGSPSALFRASLWRDGQPAGSLDLHYLGCGLLRANLREPRPWGAYRLRLNVDRSRLLASYNIRVQSSDLAFTIPRAPRDRLRAVIAWAGAILLAMVSFIVMRNR